MSRDLNKSIIYEIYPTSFYDSNGDGIGDLNGIRQKLPYVKDLGVDIIWLNPIFKSPFKDGGYDISDYYAIDKKFGTMRDFEKLVQEVHNYGLKLMLDLVVGHTSDTHKWFIRSKKPFKNKYSDWYVWTDNVFTGAYNAINGMAERNGNYIVNYYSFQPALNYGWLKAGVDDGNPYAGETWKIHYKDERLIPLRNEIKNVMKFWLDKGIDGFRVDLTASLIKGGRELEALQLLWGDFISFARTVNPDCIFMAEWGRPELSTKCGFDIDYLNHESRGYNLMFRANKGSNILPAFECGHSYFSKEGKGSKAELIDYTMELTSNMAQGGYYSIPSGYHDMVRLAEQKDEEILKCVFVFLITYKNVPLIYYGDEIGMRHNYKLNKDGGYIRTGARTPMQWTNGKNRGFSKAEKLYLPVDKRKRISIESQKPKKNSLYNTIKKLIILKKENAEFDFDATAEIIENGEYPLTYIKTKDGKKIVVAINPSEKEYTLDYKVKEVLISQNTEVSNRIHLKAKGFVVGRL